VQLTQVRQAYPSARLLGGNTASGLYKNNELDEVEDEEENGQSDGSLPRVVVCLERVKEVHGFVHADKSISTFSVLSYMRDPHSP
jgi:hypothetical protein